MMLIVAALCATSVLLQPRFVLEAAALPQTMPSLVVTRFAAPWQAPLRAMHVSSPFGPRNDPGRMPHGGVDLRARRGTAVMAPAAGTVAISTDRYAGGDRYGKVVAIDHADGTRSLYAHLATRLVQAGDLVRAGQQIALSGATGKVTGPHLHFEVTRDGANVDPLSLLQPHRP
jgi:murein DD-endopeptidase MepM/ murein hydrolase activator NlpD